MISLVFIKLSNYMDDYHGKNKSSYHINNLDNFKDFLQTHYSKFNAKFE